MCVTFILVKMLFYVYSDSYLTGLRAIGIKLNLLHSQLSSCIHIVTEVDPAKGSLTKQFAQSPVGWSPWC